MKKAFKILSIFLLTVLILLLLTLLFLTIKSNNWKREFEAQINSEYMVGSLAQEVEFTNQLNEKIEKYVMSEENIDFVSFSPKEVSQFIYNSLSEMTQESNVSISNVYVQPSKNIWEVCVLLSFDKPFKFNTWLCTNVSKDNMQTAQLYVTNFKVQGIEMGKILPSVLSNINQGIAESLVTVNENRFVGRKFENIELEESQMIVKGSLY